MYVVICLQMMVVAGPLVCGHNGLRGSLSLQGSSAGEDACDREELPGSHQRGVDRGGRQGRPDSQNEAGRATAAPAAR